MTEQEINKLIADAMVEDTGEQIGYLNQVLEQRRIVETEKMALLQRMAKILGVRLGDYPHLFPSAPSNE